MAIFSLHQTFHNGWFQCFLINVCPKRNSPSKKISQFDLQFLSSTLIVYTLHIDIFFLSKILDYVKNGKIWLVRQGYVYIIDGKVW